METNKTLEIIRSEIERRKGYISVTHFAEELLSFLSTLETEKPMNQEELEEEYKDYVVNDPVYSKLVNRNAGLVIARHFAQWGAKHLADDSKTSPNDLEEAARHSEILTYPMPEDGDIEKVFKVQEARFFHEIGFIAGAKCQKEQDEKEQADLFTIVALDAAQRAKEQMMKDAVKWLVDDDYHDLSEKGRFILGSVGLGYNGYYIPYSDLLKLPKEDEK